MSTTATACSGRAACSLTVSTSRSGECARLAETGATVVHCPTSNTFLGSGLFDAARLRNPERPVGIGLATDVGGGTSYSMLHTMGEAYKVAMLRGQTLSAHDLFHLATRGNAVRLGLDAEIGTPRTWALGGSGGARSDRDPGAEGPRRVVEPA